MYSSVEQRTENPRVGGSIPPLATISNRWATDDSLGPDDMQETLGQVWAAIIALHGYE